MIGVTILSVVDPEFPPKSMMSYASKCLKGINTWISVIPSYTM